MNTWTPYPNGWGWYLQDGDLVLTARDNGAWSVHDSSGRIPPRSSTLAPIICPGLDKAKAKAEEAAKEMNEARVIT